MINPMELTGKHILITGGSSGIGRAAAVQASRLGAKVTIIARNEERLQETISMMDNAELHQYYVMDLNEVEKIESLIKQIVAERGAIDGFCHAAGIGTARVLKSSKISYVEKMFKIHVFSFIEMVRCLSLNGNLNMNASIVGVSSVAAEKGNISQCIYGSAKAAMNGFVIPAALELSSRNIRINTVAFAMVRTEMFDDFLDVGGDVKVLNRQYLGVIDVESAVSTINYLFSDSAKFITGSIIPVYAGY